jgi:uncharacterized membrane protein
MTTVFVPTTPNPTSGFMLFVPRSKLRMLTMSVEDGAKMIFSAGLVTPEFVTEGQETPDQATNAGAFGFLKRKKPTDEAALKDAYEREVEAE